MLGRNLIFLVIFLDDYLCDAYSGTYFNSNVYSERLVEVEGQMLALCDFILEEENKLHDGVDVHNFSSIQTYVDSELVWVERRVILVIVKNIRSSICLL